MEKISWRTKEYFHTPKNADWYWLVIIVTISIALIAIILNNVLFAILIIVSSFTLSLFASKPPETVDVVIDNYGVVFGKEKHLYKDLESFWIETRDVHPRILLKSKKVFKPYIVIFTENIDTETLRQKLYIHLPEEEHSEPLLEKLLIYLGF